MYKDLTWPNLVVFKDPKKLKSHFHWGISSVIDLALLLSITKRISGLWFCCDLYEEWITQIDFSELGFVLQACQIRNIVVLHYELSQTFKIGQRFNALYQVVAYIG